MDAPMGFWELDAIKSVVGGTWLARPESAPSARVEGCATDTRSLKPGQVYVAIRGERFDGNAFVAQAAAAGAPLAIVDRPEAIPRPCPGGIAVLSVPDAGVALLRLAAAYRRTLEGTRVIAVTGSNGKTTTVRLTQAVLSQTLRGTASIKSFNNRVGVPLTVLGARRGDQFLICEVGTNALGEIAELAAVVEPEIVVVTSIGREHLEGLKSVEGAVSEVSALVNAVRPGGVVVMNGDVPLLDDAVAALAGKNTGKGAAARFNIVRFGFSNRCDLRIGEVSATKEGIRFTLNDRTAHAVPLLGRHNALNATAAVAVARRLGVDAAAADRGLASAPRAEMRLDPVHVSGIEILNDAYNANPESVLAAIETFTELVRLDRPAGRAVVVLGDMLELGDAGPSAHREIGDALAAQSGIDLAVLAGPLCLFAAERVRRAWPGDRCVMFERMDAEVADRIAALLRPGDRVLLKGSRGMGLERVVASLRARTGAPEVKVTNGVRPATELKRPSTAG